MPAAKKYIALDIGEKRTGVAFADEALPIVIVLDAIKTNEDTFSNSIKELAGEKNVDVIIIGYPRNQSGEATKQTEYVKRMAATLSDIGTDVVFQDESLTSVLAEQRIRDRGEVPQKGMIDSEAARIILEDYMGMNR